MADLNFIIVTGVATKDAVLRHRASGIAKAEFSLEVERPFTRANGDAVSDLFLVDIYGPLAERCVDMVQQGTRVMVVGMLNKECYVTRHGRREHIVVIKAKYFRVLRGDVPVLRQLPMEALKTDHWTEALIVDCIQKCSRLFTE
ncbi:MAG: single-stranded DNA-binding protein [Abditibacteriales bacterium]|nr:single-stranded DNA-binding protein [Abditibacteriales bacterium]MDW8368338.1 single-stranded DNA-binding protein [Abditibacteriales bacterium]